MKQNWEVANVGYYKSCRVGILCTLGYTKMTKSRIKTLHCL
jgi:hypothetical protein